MSYWSVVVKLPPDPKAKIVMEYAPALIFFECDNDIKGIAAFSDQDEAQAFRQQVAAMMSMEVLCIPLNTVEDVRAWCDILMKYLGPKKYAALPIYLDPPDAYCKDVRIPKSGKNLWTFIAAKMPEGMHPLLGDIAGFEVVHKCGVAILKERPSEKYAALVCTDEGIIWSSGLEMVLVYLEDQGTTIQNCWGKTEPRDSIFEACTDAKELIEKQKPWRKS